MGDLLLLMVDCQSGGHEDAFVAMRWCVANEVNQGPLCSVRHIRSSVNGVSLQIGSNTELRILFRWMHAHDGRIDLASDRWEKDNIGITHDKALMGVNR